MTEWPPVESYEQTTERGEPRPVRRGERAEEPAQTGRGQQQADPALGTAQPGNEADTHEDDPDAEIRDRESDIRRRSRGLEWAPPQGSPLGKDPECGRQRKKRQGDRTVHLTGEGPLRARHPSAPPSR